MIDIPQPNDLYILFKKWLSFITSSNIPLTKKKTIDKLNCDKLVNN